MTESIHELKLEPCCQEALQKINEQLRAGRHLRIALGVAPFMSSFGANPAIVLYTILSTDWELWRGAMGSVPQHVRSRCRSIALMHSFDHPGGKLNRFWVAMEGSFE